MKFYVIVTRDIAANVFSTPMFVPHLGQAIRSFGDQCRRKDNDPNNVLGNHPEDFELVHICNYDDVTGTFTSPSGDYNAHDRTQLAVGSNYKE